MAAASRWFVSMRFIVLPNGLITSDPHTSCSMRWSEKSLDLNAEFWVWQPQRLSQLRDRFAVCLISLTQTIWSHRETYPDSICNFQSRGTTTRPKLWWHCSSLTPSKGSPPFSYSELKDAQLIRLPAFWTRTESHQLPTMLVKQTSRETTSRSNSLTIRQESCVVPLHSPWVSTRVISSQLFTSICQEPLKTTCKKSVDLAVTAPSHAATCSWMTMISIHCARSPCKICSTHKVATDWPTESYAKPRENCFQSWSQRSSRKRLILRNASAMSLRKTMKMLETGLQLSSNSTTRQSLKSTTKEKVWRRPSTSPPYPRSANTPCTSVWTPKRCKTCLISRKRSSWQCLISLSKWKVLSSKSSQSCQRLFS